MKQKKYFFLKIKQNKLLFYNINKEIYEFSYNDIKSNIDKILGNLEYCLYNVGLDKHATTILFQYKNPELIISFFNSGAGINHNGKTIGNGYYKPFKSFSTDKTDIFQKILTIILIPEYYNLVTILINDTKKKIKIDNVEKMYGTNYKTFKKLIDISQFLHDNELKINLIEIINYEFTYNTKKYNINNLYEYPIEEYYIISNNLSKIPINNKSIKKPYFLYDTITFDSKDSYYKIILDYVESSIGLIYKNDYKFIDFSEDYNYINENIRDKIVFYYKNNSIYIKSQESGSCTWFSIYWVLLYFYISNKEKYNNMIKKIYNTFLDILNKVFNQDDFIKTKNLLLKKILYNKFYHLKFINNELSSNNIDSIYSNHTFKYEINNINNYSIIKKLNKMDDIIFINDFMEKGYENIEVYSFIDLYNYYEHDKIFNEDKPNIIDDYGLDINELLINFQESYDSENTFYINIFISYSLYINDIYKKYNFDDDNELTNFCKYLYRYDIFIKICNKIYNKTIKLITNIDTFQDETQKIYNNILPIIFNEKNREFNFNNYYTSKTIGGIKFKDEYIKKYFDITSGCKHNINHFINIDDSSDKAYLRKYKRTINDYKKLREYLYQNPKYIYQDFNYNDYEIREDYYILFNIYDIFKNEKYRDNLITFYANKFYDKFKITKNRLELFWILFNLQLLLTKYSCNIKMNYEFNSNINKFIIETSIININDFYNKINKIIDNKNKNEFIEYLKKNKDTIIKTLEIILKKHFDNYSFNIENNTININNENYNYIKYNTVDISDLSLMINKDNILLLNTNKTDLLIIDNNNYIKLIIEPIDTKNNRKYIKINIKIKYVDNSITTNFIIKEIFFNNNSVIKYNELNEPFKYIIPMNCSKLIYKINDTYHITYFCNNIEKSLILGETSLTDNYTITINKNNLMYPDNKSYKIFYKLCINFDINNLNILYCNSDLSEDTYMYLNQKYFNTFNFNKHELLTSELKVVKYIKVNMISSEIKDIFEFKTDKFHEINKEIRDNYLIILNDTIIIMKKNIIIFNDYLKQNRNIKLILQNYNILYNYLLSLNILNICNILIELLNEKYDSKYIEFCSQIKIFNDYLNLKKKRFKYNFEAIFELISGNELLNEQIERYNMIINSFHKYSNESDYIIDDKDYDSSINMIGIKQTGGDSYPLHHIMMGKGKSSILTPLLSLYFSLINKKDPIIIVPSHLLLDTEIIINEYTHIFDTDNIKILSDDKAKENFLQMKFKNDGKSIMLIDEFDYLIDPLKSNFNITLSKDKSTMDIFNILVPSEELKTIKEHKTFLLEIENNDKIESLEYKDYLIEDINKIIIDIKNYKIIENINWGIHPIYFYVIPYKNKDTPLLTSNFSSYILTIYLTLYYYIEIHNYNITETVVNCINNFGLFNEIFEMDEPVSFTLKNIQDLSTDENFRINKLFKILFKNIFEGIKISEYQYNTSFIDIINIDNLFKIGYSGTLNIIDLDIDNTKYNFNKVTNEDVDEQQNIKFAILKSNILKYESEEELFNKIRNDKYDALIDCICLLKDHENQEIAIKICKLFLNNKKVIFIDKNNYKFVVLNNLDITQYDSNINYDNPFIYFDQGHILGVDIKQDMYPIMKGLCIIDNNSIYSVVAQGMYRLRKLNMGHTINFLYKNNIEFINNIKLFDDLRKKEKEYNDSMKINLEYQILKSNIRKKRVKKIEDKEYDSRYYEKIKYYNLDKIDTTAFDQIFDYEELEKINENIIKNIPKLVYNLNSYDSSHVIQIESDKITLKKKDVEVKKEKIISSLELNKEDVIKFEFKDYSKINDESKIIYDSNIEYLPNIFTQVNGIQFINNNSGYLFVYINNKILIIPGYLIIYYNDYPIFNYKLNYINNNKIDKLDELKKLDFFKVLYNKNDFDTTIDFILYRILSDNKKLFDYQIELMKKYNKEDRKKIIENILKLQNFNIAYDKYFKKYLLYKKKYLKSKHLYLNNE